MARKNKFIIVNTNVNENKYNTGTNFFTNSSKLKKIKASGTVLRKTAKFSDSIYIPVKRVHTSKRIVFEIFSM